MKKILIIILLFCVLVPAQSQENSLFPKSSVSADIGSVRNRYAFPISNLQYKSSFLFSSGFRFSARIRSYGNWFFFSPSSMDITPQAEYVFGDREKKFLLGAGAGLDVRLRLANDERSTASSSAEPVIFGTAYANLKRWMLAVPLWTRFYSNGIALTFLPEAAFSTGRHSAFYLRYELSFQQVYNGSQKQWRQDNFIGYRFHF